MLFGLGFEIGDIDVAEMETKILASFGNWQARQGESPEVPLGRIDTARTDEIRRQLPSLANRRNIPN